MSEVCTSIVYFALRGPEMLYGRMYTPDDVRLTGGLARAESVDDLGRGLPACV